MSGGPARGPDGADGWRPERGEVPVTVAEAVDYARSIRDCEETLTRNPVHFGALSGEGLFYMPAVRQSLAQLDRLARLQSN